MDTERDIAAYWDNEAVTDPRYAAGKWHINLGDDPGDVLVGVLANIWPHVPDGGGVLEIGCGPGRLLLPSAVNFPKTMFVGIDASKKMLSLAAAKRAEIGLTTNNVALFNASNLDLFVDTDPDDESFGLIFMVEVMQHLTDDEARSYIHQAHRCLKPGGKMVVQFVNEMAAGNDGPYSYPRTLDEILDMFSQDWERSKVGATWDSNHSQWTWVVATR